MLCNILFNIINLFYLILFEHIVFNFAYYYFDSLIYKGDLYFWESEFTMIAISIVTCWHSSPIKTLLSKNCFQNNKVFWHNFCTFE